MSKVYQTPGVYIQVKDAFPNSVVVFPTAVPAFIGYTEKATYDNMDFTHVPTRISSFGEYLSIFGEGPKSSYAFPQEIAPDKPQVLPIWPRFLLFHCIKMFFVNGGSVCYIVSVGNYRSGFKLEDFDSETTENGVTKPRGLRALLKEPEPAMVVIPEAVCLNETDCQALQRSVLKHCGEEMRSRFAILDVYDGFKARTNDDMDVIDRFRNGIGAENLQWGAAYYPWLHTSITRLDDLDFTFFKPAAREKIMSVIMAEVIEKMGDEDAKPILLDLWKGQHLDPERIDLVHKTLMRISSLYLSIMTSLLEQINLLPPSAAMAGVYAMVDNKTGVFNAPANVSISSVVRPAVNLTSEEQEDLNVPLDGKAVNAIRSFPGQGVLAWGARTLDGNSQDWHYINVKRTVICLEQSIKFAIAAYVFEPNTANTWVTVKSMIANFLTYEWQQGALAGATPDDAFSVNIGLGETMTPQDILDGYMRLTVKIAITRPAEFIVLTFEQQMQQS